jgi:hypothetical protein
VDSRCFTQPVITRDSRFLRCQGSLRQDLCDNACIDRLKDSPFPGAIVHGQVRAGICGCQTAGLVQCQLTAAEQDRQDQRDRQQPLAQAAQRLRLHNANPKTL